MSSHPAPSTASAAWAQALGEGVEPELVARVIGCLAGGVWPELVLGAVAARARAGGVEVADVLDDVERALASRPRPAVGERGPDQLARALLDQGARVLLAGRPRYPERLAWAWPELGAPPWLLWRGAPPPHGPAVAVVGTRRATHDGLTTARALGRFLAARGITVVSGMARGIDQAAHLGALDAGGPTVAVLGTGFGVDYPHGDGALRDAVAASGGLVTEHPPGTPPRPHHFLTRNRIVAALADAVVVVEGHTRSGALHTARLAAEAGRDVFACPGSLNAPASRGPLDLVRDGAQVLTDFAALLDVLPVPAAAVRPLPPGARGRPLERVRERRRRRPRERPRRRRRVRAGRPVLERPLRKARSTGRQPTPSRWRLSRVSWARCRRRRACWPPRRTSPSRARSRCSRHSWRRGVPGTPPAATRRPPPPDRTSPPCSRPREFLVT